MDRAMHGVGTSLLPEVAGGLLYNCLMSKAESSISIHQVCIQKVNTTEGEFWWGAITQCPATTTSINHWWPFLSCRSGTTTSEYDFRKKNTVENHYCSSCQLSSALPTTPSVYLSVCHSNYLCLSCCPCSARPQYSDSDEGFCRSQNLEAYRSITRLIMSYSSRKIGLKNITIQVH